MSKYQITEDDILSIWYKQHLNYFVDLLNGKYTVAEMRTDLISLIGTEFDDRTEESKK